MEPGAYLLPTTTKAKNERETIRSFLSKFCDEHGLYANKERVLKYNHTWELIKDCINWYPKEEDPLPLEFVKAVSFPVNQGDGQLGRGYRSLKHCLIGKQQNEANERQRRIRDDINNWVRRNQNLPCRRDALERIGLEMSSDRRNLRDVKSSWVRLAHHYKQDYSDLLQVRFPSHQSRRSRPLHRHEKLPIERRGVSPEEIVRDLQAVIQKIQLWNISAIPQPSASSSSSSSSKIASRIQNEQVNKRQRTITASKDIGGHKLLNIPMRHSGNNKHDRDYIHSSANEIICDADWEIRMEKRRYCSRDFKNTPFERDFGNLKSLDLICSDNDTSFGPQQASISIDKKLIEFVIPGPPDATKALRVDSQDTDKPLAAVLECQVRLISRNEKDPPVFVTPFKYYYPFLGQRQSVQPKQEEIFDAEMAEMGELSDSTIPSDLSDPLSPELINESFNPWDEDTTGPGFMREGEMQNFFNIDSGIGMAAAVDVEMRHSHHNGGNIIRIKSGGIIHEGGMDVDEEKLQEKAQLHRDICENDLDKVKFWFKNNKSYTKDVFVSESHGRSVFDIACLKNSTKMVEFLLSLPCKPDIDFVGRKGENALCSAIANRHTEIASILIKHSADVNIETPFMCGSAFLLAILMDNYDIVEQMVKTQKVDWSVLASIPLEIEGRTMSSMSGMTAIHLAVFVRNVELLRVILKYAPENLVNKQCAQQVTPLVYAILCGEVEIVRELLKYNPRIDLKTVDGRTAMDYAFNLKDTEEEVYDMICNHPMPSSIEGENETSSSSLTSEPIKSERNSKEIPKKISVRGSSKPKKEELEDNEFDEGEQICWQPRISSNESSGLTPRGTVVLATSGVV